MDSKPKKHTYVYILLILLFVALLALALFLLRDRFAGVETGNQSQNNNTNQPSPPPPNSEDPPRANDASLPPRTNPIQPSNNSTGTHGTTSLPRGSGGTPSPAPIQNPSPNQQSNIFSLPPASITLPEPTPQERPSQINPTSYPSVTDGYTTNTPPPPASAPQTPQVGITIPPTLLSVLAGTYNTPSGTQETFTYTELKKLKTSLIALCKEGKDKGLTPQQLQLEAIIIANSTLRLSTDKEQMPSSNVLTNPSVIAVVQSINNTTCADTNPNIPKQP